MPIDRFPYLHYIPLKLGAISFALLLIAAARRYIKIIYDKRWADFKKVTAISALILLPTLAYAQSIHYAIDRKLAVGATKLLLVVVLKAICFFILLHENHSLWKIIKKTIYIVTALVIAFGFFQFVFDIFGASTKITDLRGCCTSNSTYIFPRVHSVSIEPLYFANFLLIPIWLMIHDFVFDKSARKNKFLITLFAATSSLFILSLARSALLALLVTAILFVFGLGKRELMRSALPYFAKVAGGVVLIAIAFVIASGIASRFIHKHAINGADSGVKGNVAIFGGHAIDVADQSAQTRYNTWPKAITYIKQRPLQGVGAYNSRVKLNLDQYNKGVPDTQLQPFNNDLLGLLVDLGLVGLILFAPLVIALVTAIIRLSKLHWKHPAAPFALAAIAMLIQGNFFHSILLARLWVVIGIALAGLYPRQKTLKNSSDGLAR